MRLVIPISVINQHKKWLSPAMAPKVRYKDEEIINHHDLHPDDLEQLRKILGKDPRGPKLKRLSDRLRIVEKFKGEDLDQEYADLEILADAVRQLIAGTEQGWVFEFDEASGAYDPYLVESVTYWPARGSGDSYVAAHITMQGVANMRGHKTQISRRYSRREANGPLTARGLLKRWELHLQTEDMDVEYKAMMERYAELFKKVGLQVYGEGVTTSLGEGADGDDEETHTRWWRGTNFTLGRNGLPDKLVIDDDEGWGEEETSTSEHIKAPAWYAVKDDDEEVDEDKVVDDSEVAEKENARASFAFTVPVHPYIKAFVLRAHTWVRVHVSQVRAYAWIRNIADKLILPNNVRRVIDIIVDLGGSAGGDDIIAGKGVGSVMLLSGPPGTGKTLTAEVYAERSRRPLYTVQCSQLGLDPARVEKSLSLSLDRAVRWKAILLIDEADTYIRERGNDLQQNAVVGVFLRLLEYFTGHLFLATNRETLVDDAIRSRCLAHIRYGFPDDQQRVQLWKLFFDQYKVKNHSTATPEKLAKIFPKISPRSIKQITRLAKTLAGDEPVGRLDVQAAAEVQDLESKEGAE